MAQSVSADWTTIMGGEHWFETKLSIFANNLFDPGDVTDNCYISASNGSAVTSGATAYKSSGYIPVKPWTAYIFGMTPNSQTALGIAWYDSTQTYINGLSMQALGNMNRIATSPSNACYVRFSISKGLNPDLDNTVFFREFGENLFNANTVSEAGYYINPTNGYTPSGSTHYRYSDYIEVIPGATYYFGTRNLSGNAGYAWYNESKTYISGDTLTNLSSGGKREIAPANAKYLRWTINVSVNTDWDKMSYVCTGFVNLFDKTTVPSTNQYIYYGSGDPTTPNPNTQHWHYSDYIAVTPFMTYFVGISTASLHNAASLAWYDSDKTFITYLTTNRQIDNFKRVVNAPANAAYARFSFRTDVGYDPDWEHTVFFTEYGKNLFDVASVSASGKYINYTTGAEGSASNYRHSDYIRVIPGTSYRLPLIPAGSVVGLAWYNSSQVYISGEKMSVTRDNGYVTQPAPANAAYIRFSIYTSTYPFNEANYQYHTYLTVDRGIPDIVPQYYTYDETKIHSISTSNGLFGDNPTIGGCGSGELSFSVTYNNETPARMAKCVPYVRCKNATPLTSEWIKKGEYFIDERSMTKYQGGYQTMNVHAYDAMLKAEASYPSSTMAWPASDISVVTEIANTLGVLVDARTTTMLNKAYSISTPVSNSMREVLSYIGAMYGANTIISDEGKLLMIPLTGGSDSHSLGDGVVQLDYGTDQPPYTKVTYIVSEEAQVSAGSGEDKVLEVDNPWGTSAIANACLQSLSTFRYQPFTASGAIIDPTFEIGDAVTINGITSHIYTASTEFGRLMLASLSAPLTVDVDHEYKYISPTERKYRREIADMSASITLNSQQIQLKVNSGDIISTINQSAEAVTINANKINLNGNVSVGSSDSTAMLKLEGPDTYTVLYPQGVGVYKKDTAATNPGWHSTFNATGWFMINKNNNIVVKVWPGWIVLADGSGTERAVLSQNGLQFYDQNGNALNNYPAQTVLSPYWKVTQSGWRVRSTPDDTISTNIIATAAVNATYQYLGQVNGSINIKYNSSYPSAYIGPGSGELIYQ